MSFLYLHACSFENLCEPNDMKTFNVFDICLYSPVINLHFSKFHRTAAAWNLHRVYFNFAFYQTELIIV
jgi:hypothetical protein